MQLGVREPRLGRGYLAVREYCLSGRGHELRWSHQLRCEPLTICESLTGRDPLTGREHLTGCEHLAVRERLSGCGHLNVGEPRRRCEYLTVRKCPGGSDTGAVPQHIGQPDGQRDVYRGGCGGEREL